MAVLAGLFLAGCARFEPKPISAERQALALEERSLNNPELKKFLEQNLKQALPTWPPETWTLEMLTLTAFYYQPALEVARAQYAVAQGGQITAGQRPNPTLTVTPGYATSGGAPSPWLPMVMLDFPIETAGKRPIRRSHAAHLSESARQNIATVAWQVRSELRSNVVELVMASQREHLLRNQLSFQEQSVHLQEEQQKAGALSTSELLPFRVALQRARVDLADARRQEIEARSHLAESLGVPSQALKDIHIDFPLQKASAQEHLLSAEVRRLALQNRADILGALADYAATQSALQLEIAKQYPDIRLQPGYQYDQGINKWTLGIAVDLPLLNQNQGPILEAKARRDEFAARFIALQAHVLAEIDRSFEAYRLNEGILSDMQSLAQAQANSQNSIEAQVKAGALEPLAFVNAQFESALAQTAQLDAFLRYQQSIGALESAVQQPFPLPPAIFESHQTTRNEPQKP